MSIDTKQNILNSSLELFLKYGYDGVSMKMIIDKSWISKWWIYHYFSSKEDILEQSVILLVENIIEKKEKIILDKTINPLDKLTKILMFLLNSYLENIDFFVKIHSDKKFLKIVDNIEKCHKFSKMKQLNKILEESMEYIWDDVDWLYIKEKLNLLIFFIFNFWAFVSDYSLDRAQTEIYINILKDLMEKILDLKKWKK